MSENGRGRLGRRLRRILLLLPYAIRHPGVSVDELARKFGVKKRDLIDDLHLVFLCGLPGYGPGDLIDVTVEEERVYVRMADYFAAPLRLTPAEALSLYAGGSALAVLPGMEQADALRRGLSKLGAALGLTTDGEGPGVEVRLDPGPREHLETLQRAITEEKRVSLEYLSATRGELTRRTVDPWGLIAAMGHAYLVGWDHLTDDERMFRTDRIKSAEMLEESAEVPSDFDPERYRRAWRGDADQPIVEFEISPRAARWFEDYYPVEESRELDDGWKTVKLKSGGNRWAATLLLRLGSDARNVQPEDVLNEARRLAEAIASRYGVTGGAPGP